MPQDPLREPLILQSQQIARRAALEALVKMQEQDGQQSIKEALYSSGVIAKEAEELRHETEVKEHALAGLMEPYIREGFVTAHVIVKSHTPNGGGRTLPLVEFAYRVNDIGRAKREYNQA